MTNLSCTKPLKQLGKRSLCNPVCSWASITVCGEAEEHGEEEARGLLKDAQGQNIPNAVCFSKLHP